MNRPNNGIKLVWRTLTHSGLILPGLMAGCGTTDCHPWWRIDNCATIPKGAIPPPYGTHTNAILHGQADRAEAEDFVIHKHEWYLGGQGPGPYGRRHLAAIAERIPRTPFPVVVEPVEPEELRDGPPAAVAELNDARRRYVVQYMLEHGVEDADRRVIIDFPRAEGLDGNAAIQIGQQYLQGQSGRASNYGGVGSLGVAPGGIGGGFGAPDGFLPR